MSRRLAGRRANSSGHHLEAKVKSIFTEMDFEEVLCSRWLLSPRDYGKDLLLKHVPYINIYGGRGYTEFLVKSEQYNLNVRIECKWQSVPGSVDEKFPYLIANCIEKMREPHIIIICEGKGPRKGSVEWMARQAEEFTAKRVKRKIEVMSLKGFEEWVDGWRNK